MKYIITLITTLLCALGFFSQSVSANTTITDVDLSVGNVQSENSSVKKNDHLNNLRKGNSTFFSVGIGGERGARNLFIQIAKSLKNVFLIVATIYMMAIVFRLIFTENTSEQIEKFKQGILWSIIGIIVMQLAYVYVHSVYGNDIGGATVYRFMDSVIHPITQLFETFASFIFVAIIFFSYFQMVTANGDEEKIKSGKMSILYAIIGFVVIRFSAILVNSIYGRIDCREIDLGILSAVSNSCVRRANLSEAANVVVTIIDWVNGFVGIIIVVMIILAGMKAIFGAGDEESLSAAKRSIFYIAIGVAILITSYLILNFFIEPSINNTL
ncbi:hypothetical protein MK079_04110 [Candidatus Gracilibacteria bacterium]|nr:hypothetical protein [Candidatus Gracilibacteria bacterium]